MPKYNRIYVRPTAALAAGSTTVTITNLQNPSFLLTGSLAFSVKTVVSTKTKDVFTTTSAITSTLCGLFSSAGVVYNSLYARVNENTYQVSFTVDHTVPADGSLAIIFDSAAYRLRPSSPTCVLVSGFSAAATCSFELSSDQLVRISMNGILISPGTAVQVNIINVNNPTDSTLTPTITIQSYFDDTFGTTKTICTTAVTLAKFLPVPLFKCPATFEPVLNNLRQLTDYIITLNCADRMRNATTVNIQFPSAFQNTFPSTLTCSVAGNPLLQPCSLVPRTTQVALLISKPDALQPLVVRVRDITNPDSGTYGPFMITISQYGVQYGELDTVNSNPYIIIEVNSNLQTGSNKLSLSVFPTNYGEKATYYFMLPQITFKEVPQTLTVRFDTAFSPDLGQSLECGTFTPREEYGSSTALNYDTIANFHTFPCSISDDYKLTFTIPSTMAITAYAPKDFFFYVQNIMNPSLNSQTSYSFTFTFIDDQTAVYIISNTKTINFALPPSLLYVESLSTTDTNILAPAAYTFTLNATANLPSTISNTTKEYELLVKLPVVSYPDFSDPSLVEQVVYTFLGNSALQNSSSAFNFRNSLFFSASYPDLASLGPFKLALSNMSNPDTESYCGLNAPGLPVTFNIQYVSREQGYVFGRTYPIMDQQNCLTLGKNREAIKVISPLYLRRSVTYEITLQVEQAASNLYLTPLSTFLIFEPSTVSFMDYKKSTVTLKVIVPSNVPIAEYLIRWKKQETGNYTSYLEVEDTRVIVVPESVSQSTTPMPMVHIENIQYVWTGKTPRDVLITLDNEPAEQLIVTIKTRAVDTNLEGSLDGIAYSRFPISVTFLRGEKTKKFYVYADTDAVNNVLKYSISGVSAPAYNPAIAETPFTIKRKSFDYICY